MFVYDMCGIWCIYSVLTLILFPLLFKVMLIWSLHAQ